MGKGSAWGAQQPDGGKSYENKGSDPLHTGSLTENVGVGESEGSENSLSRITRPSHVEVETLSHRYTTVSLY